MAGPTSPTPRERILDATVELLAQGGRNAVSTRAVSAAAEVQPQTIYRQFGDMNGLLAEAAHQGFREYLASKSSRTRPADPVDDLRDGWDLHIDFGLRNRALYLLMYGEPDKKRDLAEASETAQILRELVNAVARAGRLHVDIESAVAMIHATGIGVVITLIGAGDDGAAGSLSTRVREAVLSAILTASPHDFDSGSAFGPAVHASALRATLDRRKAALTPGESLLLDELLARISAAGG